MNNNWFSGNNAEKNVWAQFLPKDQIITPSSIIEKMIDRTDIDWTNPNLKICDPCCGSGRFLIYCLIKLLEAGHSEKHIIENMLYGTDISQECIDFIEKFWKFNQYKHNIKCSSILNKDWSFKNMQFDLIIMNPPYDIGGKVVKAAISHIKDTGEIINLMPLNQYKKDLFKHIQSFELVDPKAFKDAVITSNLNICILKKTKVNKYTWDQLLLASFDQNFIEFYKWNIAHDKGLSMKQNNYKEPSYFNIDTDFIETSLCYSNQGGAGFGSNGRGYKFNINKTGYGTNKFGHTGHIKLNSKKAKEAFCIYWYNGRKGESLASRVILGIHATEASSYWYMSIPQIDWDTIDTNPLWIAGQYDEAVLDVMGLKWDTNKEKIIDK